MGLKKNNWVATPTTYLWAGSWQVYLGSRRMVPNGSAWGQVSNRKCGQNGTDGRFWPPKVGLKNNNWVPIPIIYLWDGSWEV
jgi:hypothetical protein